MTWNEALAPEMDKPYFKELSEFVAQEYKKHTIYPPAEKVMNALTFTPLEDVKCVIIGQDPYHQPNQAMGLSFSVMPGIAVPKSLINIYKELHNEFGYDIPNNGDLTPWAKQGVLMLNAVLTVRASSPNSHQGKGWEHYTDAIIKAVETQDRPIVYLLWGRNAKEKEILVTNKQHLVLKAAHPSPFSAYSGFFGCNHFKQCNEYLEKHGQTPINWKIENI